MPKGMPPLPPSRNLTEQFGFSTLGRYQSALKPASVAKLAAWAEVRAEWCNSGRVNNPTVPPDQIRHVTPRLLELEQKAKETN